MRRAPSGPSSGPGLSRDHRRRRALSGPVDGTGGRPRAARRGYRGYRQAVVKFSVCSVVVQILFCPSWNVVPVREGSCTFQSLFRPVSLTAGLMAQLWQRECGISFFFFFGCGTYQFPRSYGGRSSFEELVKTGKPGRISSVPVATVLSGVEKAGSGSSCQHCSAGWICVPEQNGFSSEKNVNADVQGNYPQGITGLHMGGLLTRELFYMLSADPLSCLCWLG